MNMAANIQLVFSFMTNELKRNMYKISFLVFSGTFSFLSLGDGNIWTVLVVKCWNLIHVQIHQSYLGISKDVFVFFHLASKIKRHNKVDCPLRNRTHLKQFCTVLLMQTDTLMWRKEIFIWFFVDIVVFYCKYLLYFIIYTPADASQLAKYLMSSLYSRYSL